MNRGWLVIGLSAMLLVALPATAAADLTAFWGVSPTPETRSTKGFGIGVSLLIVGFEFEYANTTEDQAKSAPGLKTYMFDGLVMTPTSGVQLYATAGGGLFRERLANLTETSVATNIGAGAKIGLFGPIRLRVDYRVFRLRGSPLYKTPHRFYVGLNVSF